MYFEKEKYNPEPNKELKDETNEEDS